MKRPLVGALASALLTAAALTGAGAGPAAASPAQRAAAAPAGHHGKQDHGHGHGHGVQATPDFAGTVALSNCSGSLVRVPQSQPDDPALVLTNGHCLETGMPAPGTVVVDQPSSRRFTLLDADAHDTGTLQATKVAYSTMTKTDITLYQLGSSYRQITDRYGIQPLDISPEHPVKGTDITVVSGYWKQTYSCQIDDFVYELDEGGWTFKDSIRYTPACDTIGGTSGSPIIDDATGDVVGVNNTGNENGERCTINNPCEVDENGNVTVHQGINYGQQTYLITDCIGVGNKLDLGLPECELPNP
ncbi:MAG TPA: serine protease [Streptomyces sp.]|jgi:V8-like Glu-specific endopeptidase|nr:serine protease [Streptomyces sp.]